VEVGVREGFSGQENSKLNVKIKKWIGLMKKDILRKGEDMLRTREVHGTQGHHLERSPRGTESRQIGSWVAYVPDKGTHCKVLAPLPFCQVPTTW
jgi:hypothetical protein